MSEFGPPGFLPPDAHEAESQGRPPARDLSLSDEQHVFVDCIEDVLIATPGLTYHKLVDPAMTRLRARNTGAYAVFLIDTNPIYDLTVSIELMQSTFALVINGIRFPRRTSGERSFERWVDRCCRLVQRLTEGDLQLKHHVVLGVPQSTVLAVKRGSSVRELCTNQSRWLRTLTWFVPFGVGALISGDQQREYRNWYHAGEDGFLHAHQPETPNGDADPPG